MAQYDPAMQRETWVLERSNVKTRANLDGRTCLKPAGYMWVSYDGSPDRVLVPRNHICAFHDTNTANRAVPETDGTLVDAVEFVDNSRIKALDDNSTYIHEFNLC